MQVLTVADAVQSVLKQQTDFDFNVLVVDNHSSDGTSHLIIVHQVTISSLHHLSLCRYKTS
jgi:glycosyltransferase involved in cell wall biosynthesis